MSLKLFFSYSEKDMGKYHIAQIAKILKKTSEIDDIFFYHDKLFDNIYEYIEESLEKTDVLLLFCSKHTKVSNYVKIEWQGALDSKKKIIPIYETEDNIPYSLRGQIRVKFKQDDFEGFVEKVYQIILKTFDLISEKEKELDLKLKFFRGHYLPEAEVNFLEEFERLTECSSEFFQHIDDIYNPAFEKIGLILEKKRVTGIGITNTHLETVPDSLRNLKKLNILCIKNVGLKKIPNWIIDFNHLDFLSFYGNDLEELPKNIGDLNYLGIFELSNNSLSSIPESLGNMQIESLDLRNNQLKNIPLSFLNIDVSELELRGNPLEINPDLKTRFIIERLDSIDIVLPKFEFKFETEKKNKIISDKVEDLIDKYYKLNFIDIDEMWISEQKQEKIRYEILELGLPALDYLIDAYLMGYNEMQSIAEEIIDFILVDIEPNWKTFNLENL